MTRLRSLHIIAALALALMLSANFSVSAASPAYSTGTYPTPKIQPKGVPQIQPNGPTVIPFNTNTVPVSYDTGTGSTGSVFLKINNKAEVLVTQGTSGTINANFIGQSAVYQFNLYIGTFTTSPAAQGIAPAAQSTLEKVNPFGNVSSANDATGVSLAIIRPDTNNGVPVTTPANTNNGFFNLGGGYANGPENSCASNTFFGALKAARVQMPVNQQAGLEKSGANVSTLQTTANANNDCDYFLQGTNNTTNGSINTTATDVAGASTVFPRTAVVAFDAGFTGSGTSQQPRAAVNVNVILPNGQVALFTQGPYGLAAFPYINDGIYRFYVSDPANGGAQLFSTTGFGNADANVLGTPRGLVTDADTYTNPNGSFAQAKFSFQTNTGGRNAGNTGNAGIIACVSSAAAGVPAQFAGTGAIASISANGAGNGSLTNLPNFVGVAGTTYTISVYQVTQSDGTGTINGVTGNGTQNCGGVAPAPNVTASAGTVTGKVVPAPNVTASAGTVGPTSIALVTKDILIKG